MTPNSHGTVAKGEHTSLGGSDGVTGMFGPLKAAIRAILAVRPNLGVRSRSSARSSLLMNSFQGAIAVGNRTEVLLSRVDAVEKHFDSRPDDLADQRRREGLKEYAIPPPSVPCADLLLAN